LFDHFHVISPEANKYLELRALFSPFGAIRSVEVPNNRDFGFVKFEEEASLRAAVENR
jgi:RNA recognition motif-containing protein